MCEKKVALFPNPDARLEMVRAYQYEARDDDREWELYEVYENMIKDNAIQNRDNRIVVNNVPHPRLGEVDVVYIDSIDVFEGLKRFLKLYEPLIIPT